MELLIVILRVRGLILGQPAEQTLGVGIGHAACVGQGAHHGADVTAVERLQMRLADRAAVGQAADQRRVQIFIALLLGADEVFLLEPQQEIEQRRVCPAAFGRCDAISRLVAARLQAQSAAMTCSSLRESCSMMNSFYNM